MLLSCWCSRSRLLCMRLQVGAAPIGTPRRLGDGLLRKEAGGSNHSQAAVGELLLLHEPELGRIFGLEAKRVEAQVTWIVARAERGLGLELLAVKLAEAGVDAEGLGGTDATGHHHPEPHRKLGDLIDGGAAVA